MSPNQAEETTIVVTPATGLVDGQVVEVEVTGPGIATIAQCDPDLLFEAPEPRVDLVHCRAQAAPVEGEVVTMPFTVDEEYETGYRGEFRYTRCGGIVDDCLMVVVDSDGFVRATTSIHFGPPRPDPAVTVTPSSGLRNGDAVQIDVVGLGTEDFLLVAQCDRDVAAVLPEDASLIYNACLLLGTTSGGPADPFLVSATISEAWAWDGPEGMEAAHCGPVPGGCVIVAYGSESGIVVTAPITVEPSPLAVVPGDQEAGFPVHAFVAGVPGATVTIAQCATPVRVAARASRCARGQQLTLDETGDGATTLTLTDTISGHRRRNVSCTTGRCAVALFSASGRRLASVPVVVHPPDGPPSLSVEPDVDLVDGQFVDLTISGTRNTFLRYAQCDASVVTTRHLDGTGCGRIEPWALGHDDPELLIGTQVARLLVTEDGSVVDCGVGPGDCVFAVETDAGEFTSAPLSFAPLPDPGPVTSRR